MTDHPFPEPCADGAGCEDAVADLYSYIDGWSDEDEAKNVRGHLQGCETCDEVFTFHARLKGLISTECQAELPDELRSRVLTAIECYEPTKGKSD